MRRSRTIIAASFAAGAVAIGAVLLRMEHADRQWRLLDSYCTDCHNVNDRAGDLTFEGLTPESVSEHAESFEAAVRKLRGRLMPPPGSPQPEQAQIDALVSLLERSLDRGTSDEAGYVSVQRLSRSEYAHTVKGLLGVEIDPAEYLPTEIEVDGFTNIAESLSVSPAFLEQYVAVASTVAHLAIGEPAPKVATAYFPPPTANQNAYIDGMPLGTRGGMKFVHNFPADGEYRLTVTNLNVGLYPRALETEHTLVVLVDRNEAFRDNIGGPDDLDLMDRGGAPARAEIMNRFANIPLLVRAGVHEIVITFVERSRLRARKIFQPFRRRAVSASPVRRGFPRLSAAST